MIEVIGLEATLANLTRKAAELESEGTHEAKLAAAHHLRDAWVANIESEGLVDTGRYRDSVAVLTTETGEVAVHTEVPYAPLLEHGTRYMAPHPVAERALDEQSAEAVELAGKSLEKRV